MDAADLALCLRHRRGHLPDAVSVVLTLLAVLATAAPLLAQASPDLFQNLPAPEPTLVRPRVLAAYGALMTAATLGILYLYRGRDFILYWLVSWLLLAASLALVSRAYADPGVGQVMLGFALLLVVVAAGLVLLAAAAFPAQALRWSTPLRLGAAAAAWFLAAPFLVAERVVVASGAAIVLITLGFAALEYSRLARGGRQAGALLIAGGLAVVVIANVAGSSVALGLLRSAPLLGRVAIVNDVTAIVIALGMHVLVFEDMTDELRSANRSLEAAHEEVKRLAITDPLTGCLNRRFFDEIERREMLRHRRYGSPLSVVFVDINRFKQLNDTLGHDAGDEVLRAIAAMLRRLVRESDYVFRWGGDEFLLLLSCGLPEAERKAGELKLAFDQERIAVAASAPVGLSIGVAAVPKDAENLRTAIRDADASMYRDKLGERQA